MFAERFGSYSTEATLAGMPCFCRLKSIWRYLRFVPPPRNRMQMRPVLLRPPCFRLPLTSDFSGRSRVSSSRVVVVWNRRVGVVGLYVLIGIDSGLPFR